MMINVTMGEVAVAGNLKGSERRLVREEGRCCLMNVLSSASVFEDRSEYNC